VIARCFVLHAPILAKTFQRTGEMPHWQRSTLPVNYYHSFHKLTISFSDGCMPCLLALMRIFGLSVNTFLTTTLTLDLVRDGLILLKRGRIKHTSSLIKTQCKRYLLCSSLPIPFNALSMQRSMCTSHSAVNLADTKKSKGLAATGVGTVDCARHNFKLPNAVGDLQKGEK
jgi:hypothetical protein